MNAIRTLAFSFTLISSIPLANATALPIADCWHRPKGYDIELTTSTMGTFVPDLHDCMGRCWPQKGDDLCHEGGGYGGAVSLNGFRGYYCNCLPVGVSVLPVDDL